MSAGMLPLERMILESVSAILCFFLVWFMIKPYKHTGEVSFLGLPLGFGFLGVSYALAALAYSPLSPRELMWLPQITRTFAFVFLATTYVFSHKHSRKSQVLAGITTGLLFMVIAISLVLAFVAPHFALESYRNANVYLRIFNVVCLSYLAVYTLRNHVKHLDSSTIWIPFGFIFLAIYQYSLFFWYIDSSFSAFIGSYIARFAGLAIFLYVACRIFYTSARASDEKRRVK